MLDGPTRVFRPRVHHNRTRDRIPNETDYVRQERDLLSVRVKQRHVHSTTQGNLQGDSRDARTGSDIDQTNRIGPYRLD